MRASDHACVRCGHRASHAHHRLPRSRGGPDDAINVIPVCAGCHHWIHHNVAEAVEAGLLVEGYVLRGIYHGPNVDYRREYRGAA